MFEKIFTPFWIVGSLVPIVFWIVSVIEHLSKSEWIMLLIAFFIPPLGVIDGIGIFFGWW